jgi:hypothetical protein
VGTAPAPPFTPGAPAAAPTPAAASTPASRPILFSTAGEDEEDEDEIPVATPGAGTAPGAAAGTPGNSADYIAPDNVYSSDGSDDDEDVAIQLNASVAGVMTRKSVAQSFQNRQWVRGEDAQADKLLAGETSEELKEFLRRKDEQAQQEEEQRQLDPATVLANKIAEEKRKVSRASGASERAERAGKRSERASEARSGHERGTRTRTRPSL